MMFSPTMDDEWVKWYTSPRQKFYRKLEELLGVESVFIILGYPFTLAAKAGLMHKRPYLFVGTAAAKNKRKPFVLAAAVHSCKGVQVSFMNKTFNVLTYECEGCTEEKNRWAVAYANVVKDVQSDFDEQMGEDDEQEAKEGPREGALMEWPQ